MSLHHAAQHLKAQGRGPDDQLIHMSSKEIAGLQTLAKAHGTSLTTNPKTGLPEAGVLDSLMPMIVGAGLAYATGGASLAGELGLGAVGLGGLSNAAVIGGGMGLANYAQTGDLGRGLMAGLGAYGGAGLGAGLAATGAGAVPAYNAASGQVAPALTAPPSAGGLAGPVTEQSVALGGGRDALLARSVPEAQMADQLAQTTVSTPGVGEFLANNKAYLAAGAAPALAGLMAQTKASAPTAAQTGMIRPYQYAYNPQTPTNMVGAQYKPGQDTSERRWFDPQWTALTPYKAAAGGLMDLSSMAAGGGPVEKMSNDNAIGANTGFPMSNLHTGAYATPWQTPISQNVVEGTADTGVDQLTGEENRFAAGGGISTLGGYSDGGRLLKGPGDGMSDNIPAQIGDKQPARLADGEFVVPADVVSHLGNGSTDAGAKQLYKMMDKVRTARTGNKRQGKEINPNSFMPK